MQNQYYTFSKFSIPHDSKINLHCVLRSLTALISYSRHFSVFRLMLQSRISDAQLGVPYDDSFTCFWVTRAYGSSERNHKFWAGPSSMTQDNWLRFIFFALSYKGNLWDTENRSQWHILVKINSSHFISINR